MLPPQVFYYSVEAVRLKYFWDRANLESRFFPVVMVAVVTGELQTRLETIPDIEAGGTLWALGSIGQIGYSAN